MNTFSNKTTFVSPDIVLERTERFVLSISGTIGTGTVYIEVKNEDGDYVQTPELTFTENTSTIVELYKAAKFRVNISGATDTTVSVAQKEG